MTLVTSAPQPATHTCCRRVCRTTSQEKKSRLRRHLWTTYGLCKHGPIDELNPWLRAQALSTASSLLCCCVCPPEVELQGLCEHVFLSTGQTIDTRNACTLQNLLDKSQHLHKQRVKSAFDKA